MPQKKAIFFIKVEKKNHGAVFLLNEYIYI